MYKLFMRKVLLIYGATSAGKSALACEVAARTGGEIINADSLQVYKELNLLSARPSAEQSARVPHHLYGFRSARDSYSVGDWLQHVAQAIEAIEGLPIIVGGTGLYFHALCEGLSQIDNSQIDNIEDNIRKRLGDEPLEVLHARLKEVDRELFETLAPQDRQRITRGLEVYEATGVKLSEWQKRPRQKPQGLEGLAFIKTALCPPREVLVARAEARLDSIEPEALLAEVQGLSRELPLDSTSTALKALGYREFAAHLRGELTFAEALERTKRATRQYIRRQLTWHRNQMSDYKTFTSADAFSSALDADFKF